MRLFKEINFGLHEIQRYYNQYGLNISKRYLGQILSDALMFNYDNNVINKIIEYGFVNDDIDGLTITDLGKKMTEFAIDKYELSELQKKLVSTLYIERYKDIYQQWIDLFIPGENYAFIQNINIKLRQFTENMISLGVAIQQGEIIYLNNEFYNELECCGSKQITEEELMMDLEKNRELGEVAEGIAFEFEVNRLKLLEENKVKNPVLISKTNVNAGYDIKSFNNNSSEVYNRFIEVKYFNNNSFYITANEKRVAEMLGNNYYLYLVNTYNKTVHIIRNPSKTLDDMARKIDICLYKYLF